MRVSHDASGTYKTNSQFKLKPKIVKSSSCDYIDVYMLIIRTVTIHGAEQTVVAGQGDKKKQIILRDCALFTGCISTLLDNANV